MVSSLTTPDLTLGAGYLSNGLRIRSDVVRKQAESGAIQSSSDLSTEHLAATEIAASAGHMLLELRGGSGKTGDSLRNAGDLAAHAFILKALSRRFPDDHVVSEEDEIRIGEPDCTRQWIVDPLDGTREFAESRKDWAVHVALAVERVAVVGAVALPAHNLTFSTANPPPQPRIWTGPPRIVVSRTRPPECAVELARHLGGKLIEMGSAGAKAMTVVQGDAEIYVHSGGQYVWDSAAPGAVAAAAGLHVSRLDGSPLRYEVGDPWSPDLLICRRDLASTVITVCKEATE